MVVDFFIHLNDGICLFHFRWQSKLSLVAMCMKSVFFSFLTTQTLEGHIFFYFSPILQFKGWWVRLQLIWTLSSDTIKKGGGVSGRWLIPECSVTSNPSLLMDVGLVSIFWTYQPVEVLGFCSLFLHQAGPIAYWILFKTFLPVY